MVLIPAALVWSGALCEALGITGAGKRIGMLAACVAVPFSTVGVTVGGFLFLVACQIGDLPAALWSSAATAGLRRPGGPRDLHIALPMRPGGNPRAEEVSEVHHRDALEEASPELLQVELFGFGQAPGYTG